MSFPFSSVVDGAMCIVPIGVLNCRLQLGLGFFEALQGFWILRGRFCRLGMLERFTGVLSYASGIPRVCRCSGMLQCHVGMLFRSQ